MIVAFDASILIYLFDENAPAPKSSSTGLPVDRCQERVENLISTLQREKAKIIIPTPSLGEALVRAQEGAPERLRILKSSKHFRIAAFDERAAVEFAATQASRHAAGVKAVATTRAKAKFDDQIVAIARVEGANVIYSDDEDIKKIAGSRIKVIGIEDLPLPPDDAQGSFLLERAPDTDTEPESPNNE